MEYIPLTTSIKSLTTKGEDLSIKSKFANGSVRVRPRFTKERKKFDIKYMVLLISEFNTLLTFYNTNNMYTAFYFVNPVDSVTYIVRFDAPLDYTVNAKGVNIVDTSAKLVEV